MKRLVYFLSIILFISSFGCKKKQNKTEQQEIQKEAFNEVEFFSKIDPSKIENINQIIGGFSSPIEMAAIIKDKRIPFFKKYLVNTSIIDNYDTNLKKALGLGILSADLGYLNVYKKNTLMIDYLLTLKNLSDDLKVSQFFDFNTLKYLVLHSDNIDSLIFMSVNSFYSIDEYFRNTNRSHLSVLSVTGVWLESFYLITQVAKDNPQYDFTNQIGGQKELFGQLFEILKVYKGHPFFDYIINEFDKLRIAFDPVVLKDIVEEPQYEMKDGNLTIYQDVTTKVIMDEQTRQNIIKTAEHVRNNILNMTGE